ncbi:OmpP1/FadL family transporter [Cochleicola gelatinilyticus]|uniref:Transporter n=1 Tax=Cochleicola gelatinilyticus TaxID=1763537 RepID=A0A167KC43_9FLAO|nr:transporter [Cochleicola gelatinilyticus]OAB81711.1 transporter [Cochleicola gelatinilyticus]
MKKTIILFMAALAMSVANAQDITDGLRYASDFTNGTARFSAMSGAFGALGGDMSSIGINPAGSAVFLSNTASATFSVYDRENNAEYFGNSIKAIDTDVNLSQAGGVFVFNNSNEESPWKKFSIAINYENSQNHEDQVIIVGRGNTSISSFFLAQAQGIPLNWLNTNGSSISNTYGFLGATQGVDAQNAFLGYQGFIFDPINPEDPNNTTYSSNVAPGFYNQEYYYFTEGYNGKYTFNFSAQYTDNFYFGINLNSHTIDYLRSTTLYETNSNIGSTINEIKFRNNLGTRGAGFSAQVGVIAKLSNEFRVGLTIDTPTWYEISEETTQYLETLRTENETTIREIIDPAVLNVYDNYNLRTPGKYAASAAYIFGKKGLISFDYSYKNYDAIEFRPTSDLAFQTENIIIENALKGASSYRLGGEYRINQLSLRGGYRYEESPYQDKITVGDLSGFSLGLGYNFGNYNFDVAYSRLEQERRQQLYSVGLTDTGLVNTTFTNIVFTLGVNL